MQQQPFERLSKTADAIHSLPQACMLCRNIKRVPPEACGGLEHVLAVLPEDADVADAAENSSAVLLRLHNQAEVIGRLQ